MLNNYFTFIIVFSLCYYSSLCINSNTVNIDIVDYTRTIDGTDYPGYKMIGEGTNWKDFGGVKGLYIPQNQSFSVVYYNNLTNEETIIHAHGLTPPTSLDGVPYLSAVPIYPQRSVYYEYELDPIKNQGTYFIHSHFGFQFGNGLIAPLVIAGTVDNYPLNSLIEEAVDYVMLLEDICPHATEDYLDKLDKAINNGIAIPRTDFNRNKAPSKGDCSSWATFLALAYDFQEYWYSPDGFTCSSLEPATDSDVEYTKYVANGKTFNSPYIITNVNFKKPIRYRVINSGGMTNFQLKFPFEVTLICTDGQWIYPYQNDTFWVSVAQRMDFLIQVPASYNSSLITVNAWTENYVSSVLTPLILSELSSISNYERRIINSDVKKQFSNGYATGMMNNDLELEIQAFLPLSSKTVSNTQTILLTGDNGFRGINHYSYRLPPTAPLPYVPNPHPILVSYGERVQFNIQNQNADGHPMHLHGHTFQITNIDGKAINGAMRDVAFVPGGCHNVTIEFDAVNPGDWAFHCHLEFHQAAGMLTTIEYSEE